MKLRTDQVAKCLNLPETTLRRWIRQGRIPIRHISNECVFDMETLEKWAKQHNLLFSSPEKIMEKEADTKNTPDEETLVTAMNRGGFFYNIKGDTVESVLKNSVEAMNILPENIKMKLFDRLIQREELTSTGIGKGIAIPHPRVPLKDEIAHSFITTCFLEKAIDYRAVDNKPVFILFILLCPSSKHHLHLLSRLSYCVRDDAFVEFLKTAPGKDEVLAGISEFEQQLDRRERF